MRRFKLIPIILSKDCFLKFQSSKYKSDMNLAFSTFLKSKITIRSYLWVDTPRSVRISARTKRLWQLWSDQMRPISAYWWNLVEGQAKLWLSNTTHESEWCRLVSIVSRVICESCKKLNSEDFSKAIFLRIFQLESFKTGSGSVTITVILAFLVLDVNDN